MSAPLVELDSLIVEMPAHRALPQHFARWTLPLKAKFVPSPLSLLHRPVFLCRSLLQS
jgi:hypothetical protein